MKSARRAWATGTTNGRKPAQRKISHLGAKNPEETQPSASFKSHVGTVNCGYMIWKQKLISVLGSDFPSRPLQNIHFNPLSFLNIKENLKQIVEISNISMLYSIADMSPHSSSSEDPPSYSNITNEIWEPTILVLNELTIHAESVDSAPLYQLNRAVARITRSTQRVEFERVERTVKMSDDEPMVKPRSRHIYNLHVIGGVPGGLEYLPSHTPRCYIESVSRRTNGSFGIKKSHFRSHWTAFPIDISGNNSKYASLPAFLKDAKPLFQIQQKDGKNKWTDGDGSAVAVEDDGEDQHRLIITASLHLDYIDVLVALWCCRIWQYSDEHTERLHEGMEASKFSTLKCHR
jgi:hypothetical protein